MKKITSHSACTTVGLNVTNIFSDGNNGLNIEKCKVECVLGGNAGDCITSNLKLSW